MYKIFGLLLGEREVETWRLLPGLEKETPTVRMGWCIKGEQTSLLVDTGMKNEEVAKKNLVNASRALI